MPGGGAARFAQGLRGAPVAGLSLGLDAREALEVRGGGERGEPLACLGQQAGEGARLAAELARGRMQRAQARVEFGQAPGVEFGAVQVAGEFTRGVVDLDARRLERLDDGREPRVELRELRQACDHGVHLGERRAIGLGQRVDRRLRALEQARAVRQAAVLGLHGFPLARRGGEFAEFLDRPAQPVLLGERRLGHLLRGLAGTQRAAPLGPQRADLGGLHAQAAVLVEQGELRGGAQQGLMGVLAVHVDQQFAQFTQLGERGRAAVDPGAAASARLDHAAQQYGVLGSDAGFVEPGCGRRVHAKLGADFGARRAFAHHVGLGALAERELQGVDQDGLAGARLAGEHGVAGRKIELERVDDHEVADGEGQQHAVQPRVAGSLGMTFQCSFWRKVSKWL